MSITSAGFEPDSLNAPSGTTVNRTNNAGSPQTVTGLDLQAGFDSGPLQPGIY